MIPPEQAKSTDTTTSKISTENTLATTTNTSNTTSTIINTPIKQLSSNKIDTTNTPKGQNSDLSPRPGFSSKIFNLMNVFSSSSASIINPTSNPLNTASHTSPIPPTTENTDNNKTPSKVNTTTSNTTSSNVHPPLPPDHEGGKVDITSRISLFSRSTSNNTPNRTTTTSTTTANNTGKDTPVATPRKTASSFLKSFTSATKAPVTPTVATPATVSQPPPIAVTQPSAVTPLKTVPEDHERVSITDRISLFDKSKAKSAPTVTATPLTNKQPIATSAATPAPSTVNNTIAQESKHTSTAIAPPSATDVHSRQPSTTDTLTTTMPTTATATTGVISNSTATEQPQAHERVDIAGRLRMLQQQADAYQPQHTVTLTSSSSSAPGGGHNSDPLVIPIDNSNNLIQQLFSTPTYTDPSPSTTTNPTEGRNSDPQISPSKSQYKITKNGFQILLDKLHSQDPTYTELIFNNNTLLSLHPSNFQQLADAITIHSIHLTNIELINVNIKDEHIHILIPAFTSCIHLLKLNIESNIISTNGIQCIAYMAETHVSLTELRIANQRLHIG